MRNLQNVILFLLLTNLSFAQDDTFEALHHVSEYSTVLDAHPFEGGLLLVEDKGKGTMISYLDQDGNYTVLKVYDFLFGNNYSRIEWSENTNGEMDVYLIGFFDYDIQADFIEHLHFNGTDVQTQRISGYVFLDAVLIDTLFYGFNSTEFFSLSLSGVYTFHLSTLSGYSFDGGMYKSNSDEIFHFDHHVIKKFENGELNEITDLSAHLENRIRSITAYGDQHIVQTHAKLLILSNDFQNIENSYSLPSNHTAIRKPRVNNDTIYIGAKNQNIFLDGQIFYVDDTDQLSIYHRYFEEAFWYDDVIKTQEEEFLIGQNQMPLTQTLVNKFPIGKPVFENDFVNFSLENLSVEQIGIASINTFCSPPDTMYTYEASVDVNNFGPTLNVIDFFSQSVYFTACGLKEKRVAQRVETLIEANESMRLSFRFSVNKLSNFGIMAPGGNFKRDVDLFDNTVSTDFVDSNKDLFQEQLVSYPNPAHDFIQLNLAEAVEYRFQIYTLTGQLIHQGRSLNQQMHVATLIPGFYIAEIKSGDRRYYTEFVKQ